MNRLHRYLLLLVAGMALSVFPADISAKQPTPVIIQEVINSTFVDPVEALGTLRSREQVELTASVTETITAIHFEDGQRVEQGDVLVEMTSREEHAQLEEERHTMAEAKRQYDRMRSLFARGAVAKSLLDEEQREFDTARARLQAIEARLSDRLITAPFSGVLGLRNISVGALIEPGDVITTLDDDSLMKLDFNVPAVFLASLRQGIAIEARSSAFSDRVFGGEISSINSRIDPITRTITVRAVLPNQDRLLKPGLLMQVTLLKNQRTVPVIPEEALIPVGKDNYVLVVAPHSESPVAQRRQVRIGQRRTGEVEIVEGLDAGEYVVTHGTIRARPGEPVTIMTEQEGGESLEQLLSRGAGEPAP